MESKNYLKNKLLQLAPSEGQWNTTIKGLYIARKNHPTPCGKCLYKPIILYMAQGEKRTILDSAEFVYGENQCLITSIDIPSASMVVKATPERPCLGLVLELDEHIIAETIKAANLPKIENKIKVGMSVANVDEDFAGAFLRLINLLEKPKEQQKALAPLIIREIYYRLLISPAGNELRLINTLGTQSNQVNKAISWLKNNFTENLNVENLAKKVNMSSTSFYRNFSKITNSSPIQYQKQLRLYEAQRLMLLEKSTAEMAAFAVGYKSSTQFNRDYKHLFGNPPKKDIKAYL